MTGNLEMVICHSDELDTNDLLEDLLDQAEGQLNGRNADACVLLVAIDFDYQCILDGIHTKWNDTKLIGGTTDGELSSRLGFREDSAVLIIFSSSQIQFAIGLGEYGDGDMERACRDAVGQAQQQLEGTAGLCLTVSGNQHIDSSEMLRILEDELTGEIPVFGGIPADQWRFEKQYQFAGASVYENAVPILLISENIRFTYGIDSGWHSLGDVGVVTRSEGNTVYTIDNRSAKDYYEETLGMSLTDTFNPGEFPIIILDENETFQFQRAPVGFLDDNSGGMQFFGGIPEGSNVTIAGADRDAILAGTESSISRAIEKISKPDRIVGAFIISCSGRRVMLGTRIEREQEILCEKLGPDVPFGGFYGYGEFAPPQRSFLRSGLHNQTIVSLIFLSD